jgi:hypothetical protein
MPIRNRHCVRWLAVAGVTFALGVASVPSAGAAATIGELPPGEAELCFDGPLDLVQTGTFSPRQYAVPSNISQPVITSWSHRADSGIGQLLSFKVFRKIAEPSTYVQVAHDGPRSLTPGVVNVFSVSLPVQAGDLIGINTENAAVVPNACSFTSTPSFGTFSARPGSLNDGQSGDFTPDDPGERINVRALVKPSNRFTVGPPTRNTKKGTAILPVTIPGPGRLALSGTGIQGRSLSWGRGTISLGVKAAGRKKRRKLKSRGKTSVLATITFTPRGGDAASQSIQLQLKKKLKRSKRKLR